VERKVLYRSPSLIPSLTPFLSRGVGISRDRGAEVLRLRPRRAIEVYRKCEVRLATVVVVVVIVAVKVENR
jgi:hypothetical protein